MSRINNSVRIASETLQAIKLDTAIATKTGIAQVVRPDSYDKVASLIVQKNGLLGGVRSLIDNNTKIDAGVSSFDNKYLQKGETWIINGLRVLGSDDDPASVKPGDAIFHNRRIDPAIQSALFKIVQGKTLLDMPIRRFFDFGDNSQDYFVPLVKAVTLLPETPFNFTIEAATNSTLAIKNGYLLFEFDVTVILTNAVRQNAC